MTTETSRLIIRPIQATDAEAIFVYRKDYETNKYQGWVPNSVEDVHEFLRNRVSYEYNVPDTWFQCVLVHKTSRKIVGDVGIHFIYNHQVEFGCTIDKTYHGSGYATEALNAVIQFLFHTNQKHRIVASVDPRNIGSLKLMQKLGFRQEAHFRKSILINQEWCDDVVFAILHEEWNK